MADTTNITGSAEEGGLKKRFVAWMKKMGYKKLAVLSFVLALVMFVTVNRLNENRRQKIVEGWKKQQASNEAALEKKCAEDRKRQLERVQPAPPPSIATGDQMTRIITYNVEHDLEKFEIVRVWVDGKEKKVEKLEKISTEPDFKIKLTLAEEYRASANTFVGSYKKREVAPKQLAKKQCKKHKVVAKKKSHPVERQPEVATTYAARTRVVRVAQYQQLPVVYAQPRPRRVYLQSPPVVYAQRQRVQRVAYATSPAYAVGIGFRIH